MSFNNRLPDGGNVIIEFHHHCGFNQVFKEPGKAYDTASGERLN